MPSFLHRYDTEFYRVWMQRAGHFTRRLHERFPWLPDLCERCQRRLPAFLPPATIIHGEYRADNILLYAGRSVAIDWGSAVLAAGEIDLASLTWGWGDDLVELCRQQYCLAPLARRHAGRFRLATDRRAGYSCIFYQLSNVDEEDRAKASCNARLRSCVRWRTGLGNWIVRSTRILDSGLDLKVLA